ncbi:MAG TPA: DUF5658 family protein, partial [Woeseiaceae bacterium]|nr:DUF5658 family protein [Woeseiaceae bacterium]
MNDSERADEIGESRVLPDRRAFTWRTFVFGYFLSRRREHRRTSERDSVFIDWHHPWLFFLGTGIMLLSTVDAFLTLQLLSKGAIEINPIMDLMLDHSHIAFAVTKMLLTGLGILVLVFLARLRLFNFMRTGLLLTLFFSFYACLVCYQAILL